MKEREDDETELNGKMEDGIFKYDECGILLRSM